MNDIVAPLINFAIVVFILWKYGRQPMREFLAARSKNIENLMREAEAQSEESKRMLSEAEALCSSSASHVEQSRLETEASIKRWREQTLSSARAEASRIRQEASLVGQSETIRARQALQRELVERSVGLASQFLQNHLGETEKHRLVSEYVESVGNGTSR